MARLITLAELALAGKSDRFASIKDELDQMMVRKTAPVIGITGTGGAGKSSLTDELVIRLLNDHPDLDIGIISCDPSRRKTGGALLGDRIRMNGIETPRVYMRSIAVRRSTTEVPAVLPDAVNILKAAGFDFIIAETAGIGQGSSNIVDISDVSLYVMTSEYGAASQLEKIDMLDYADITVINKFDKEGSDDAIRDVRKQLQRNRKAFDMPPEQMPVFGTIASRFNDDGVTSLYTHLLDTVAEKTGIILKSKLPAPDTRVSTSRTIFVPPERTRYLAEISETVRKYHKNTKEQAEALRNAWHLKESARTLESSTLDGDAKSLLARLKSEIDKASAKIDPAAEKLMGQWSDICRILYERRTGLPGAGPGNPRPPVPDIIVQHPDSQSRPARFFRSRPDLHLHAQGKRSRPLPLYRRGFPLEAHGRRPHPDVCR